MPTFDELIQSIHGGNKVTNVVNDDDFNIVINPNTRALEAESGFNNVIGVTNDYNAEEIIFKCPKIIEGHSVFDCSNKTVKWQNQTSKMGGSQALIITANPKDESTFLMKWTIPPAALTQAGQLHIAISFCDKHDSVTVYKWNSQIYTQLNIIQGMDSVTSSHLLNKTLTVDVYTREFYLPNEFNTVIGYTGDSGLNTLTFRINRYYQNIDLTNGTIKMYWTNAKDETGEFLVTEYNNIESLSGEEVDDMIEFDWKISNQLLNYAGKIQLYLSIIAEHSGERISWNSKIFNELEVKEGSRTPEITIDTVDYSLPIVDRNILATLLKTHYNYEW